MIKKTILFLVLFFLCRYSIAQPDFDVTGIIWGKSPVAVVNSEVVTVGSVILGATITNISKDSVAFEYEGNTFTKKLKSFKESANNSEIKSSPKDKGGSSLNNQEDRYLDNINKAYDLVSQADQLLSGSLKFISLYDAVLKLYDSAERELQYALEKTFIVENRNKVKSVLSAVVSDRLEVYREKEKLKANIQEAIDDHNLIVGMTAEDIRQSVGSPTRVNHDTYRSANSEQWIYGDQSYSATYLYLDNHILSSIQRR